MNDYFSDWLDDEQPFYGYLHQGADGEKIRLKTVEDIAEHYLDELLKILPKGPYILGGHSFGGLVAYEMAYRLLKREQEVPLLIMLDSVHPDYFRDYVRINAIHNLAKKIVYFPSNTWADSARFIASIRGRPIPPHLRTRYILSTYDQAAMQYNPSRISCPVVLFRASDTINDDETNGWSKSSDKEIVIQHVPGDHLSMIRSEENYKILAPSLLEQINNAQKKYSNCYDRR